MRLPRRRPRALSLRRKSLYAALVALPIIAVLLFGNRGLLKRLELERHASGIHEQLYRDRAVGDSLRHEITVLQNDTTAIERLARERYGLARTGETIYRVEE